MTEQEQCTTTLSSRRVEAPFFTETALLYFIHIKFHGEGGRKGPCAHHEVICWGLSINSTVLTLAPDAREWTASHPGTVSSSH